MAIMYAKRAIKLVQPKHASTYSVSGISICELFRRHLLPAIFNFFFSFRSVFIYLSVFRSSVGTFYFLHFIFEESEIKTWQASV